MCFSSKKTSTTTTNQTQGPEKWVRDEGKDLYGDAKALVDATPYKAAEGPMIDAANADWQGARDQVNALASGPNSDYTAARGEFDKAGSNYDAVAKADDPTRSVESYMNPYLEQVLGPAIRKMLEQGQIARNQIGGEAAMAGAYGDSRHGIETALQRRDENQNIGDTTGKLYAAGWDNAVAQRAAALDRIMRAGQAQQGLGTSRQGLGTAADTRSSTIAQLLAGLSDKERATAQAETDRARRYPFEAQQWLMSMLNQTPANMQMNGTSTTVSKGSDNSGFGLLGKLLGGALAPALEMI